MILPHHKKALAITTAYIVLVGAAYMIAKYADQKIDELAESTNKTTQEQPASDIPGVHLMNGRISIPEYDNITITKNQPLMGFNNPIENTDIALLRYTAETEHDGETVQLIPEEMWILPGKTVPINIYDQLTTGQYDTKITIYTMDPETDYELGTEVQNITITVN